MSGNEYKVDAIGTKKTSSADMIRKMMLDRFAKTGANQHVQENAKLGLFGFGPASNGGTLGSTNI